ncbi:hypothetical protein QJQ45_027599 [Haematococcus lacustris]|nr:hypothetical protein QJQ45_027599 [Haematococcus lacustris]
MADAANVHIVRQHLEARQGEAGTSLEVDNHNVDRLLLEWLLHDGMPLTIVESGAFLEFVRALKPDWTPPSRYLLSHRMMLDVYQGVITAVVERVETQPFVAMSVDGWSKDMGSAHCLAWCAAWWGQAYLVDCINTEANSEGKVCALVTDTPSTHKALWRLVEEKYPKVLGVPCQMHVQDLYLKDLLTLELVIKHCEVVRDIIKYYTLSSCLAQQLEVFQNLHNIRKGLELSGGVRMHSCSSMLSSLQVNKPALCSAVTDASFLRPGLTAAQQQRAGSIRAIVLSPNFWAENQVLVHTMRPVVHLQIDLQSDNANIADAYYAHQLGPTASTPFQPPPGPAATTPSQPGSQPVPVPSVVLSGPPGPLAAALSATMPPQVLARFLAYLANQQAIVDGSGGSSTTGVVGQQSGGNNPTGLAGEQPGGSSTTTVVGQQPGGSSTTGLAGQQPGGSSTTTVVGQQPGGSSTTGLAGQQPGGSNTTGLAGQPSSRSFAVTALQMYNKRLQYGASAAQYLAALLDPRYRRLSQHVTREQCKLAEQLLIKLATEDGSEGDRPAAEALSQPAIWQQPDVVLFSHTSLSAVYFAPQLTSDPVSWWRQHGDFAPKLQTVAQRVLCIPATAAANERVFSAFSHVWSDKRASLILGRMWVMAYIYFNKRVLERKPKTLSDADWEEYERWMRKTPQDQDQN